MADHELLQALPSLKIFEPLSPTLGVADQMIRGITARLTGRSELARETYLRYIERIAQPDRPIFRAHMRGIDAEWHSIERGFPLHKRENFADATRFGVE